MAELPASLHSTTPNHVTPLIRRLCRTLAPGMMPRLVTVDVDPDAELDSCVTTVQRRVTASGGAAVHGWTIWESPLLVEAEFHTIWQSPAGTWVDVTPKRAAEAEILFLHDPNLVYQGRQIDNVRLPVYQRDPLVRRLATVSEAIFRVMNVGDRAGQHGMMSIPSHEIAPLLLEKERVLTALRTRPFGRTAACVCGSAKMLKNCCGK